MNKLSIIFLLLTVNSFVFAGGKGKKGIEIRATDVIENKDFVEIVEPYIWGCASEECYGGPGDYFLKRFYPGKKICRKLGYGNFIRGSKRIEKRKVSMVYSLLGYHVIERMGPPGQPEEQNYRIIVSLKCKK